MHFTVAHSELAQALQKVSRAVPARTTLPVLTGILLSASAEGLTLTATNLDIGISCRIPAEIGSPGSMVLPARYLTDIVRHIPGGAIAVSADLANNTAQLRWSTSHFTIHGHAADQFPALPELEPVTELALPARVLGEVLDDAIFAVSHDEARPILTGIQLTSREGFLQAISTDGFRIAVRRARVEEGLPRPASLVIPGKNAAELLHLRPVDGMVELLATANQALFRLGDTLFFSRLLDGSYPAILDLIPREFRTRIRLDRQAFHDACERVGILADPLQKTNALTLSREGGALVLTATSPAVGTAREELPAAIEGEDFQIIFNARYLAEGLRHSRSDEALLELSGPLTAARLTAPGEGDFLYVLMPMRPSEGA